MFSIKLTARPDARMVEVPLDIEAELPREFDGAAVLVSSGMPRKVRLRAPKDSIKLSTAYRLDQLIGDLVRSVLRGAQQDVARVQDAAAQFVKLARERRQEGLTFVVESDGRGQIDVVEQAPPPSPNAFRSSTGMASSGGLGGERLLALERGMAALETRLSALEAKLLAAPHPDAHERSIRALGEQLGQRLEQRVDQKLGQRPEPRGNPKLEQRLAALEAQLASLQPHELHPRTPERTAAHLPTPGASRAGLRRATAVEAFADGLRTELKARVHTLLQRAEERAALYDAAARVAADAERAGGPKLPARAALQQLASEAGARTSALGRISEEIELYPASEIPLSGQLIDRLGQVESADFVPHLRAVVEEGARAGTLQLGWLTRAAQLAGWKVIAPSPGDLFEPSLHELEGPRGDVIEGLLMPGVHDKSGAMLLHARVRARMHDDELAGQALAPDGSQPLAESNPEAAEARAPESLAAADLAAVEPLPNEGETPGSDDEVISAQILEEISALPPEPLGAEPPMGLPFVAEPFIPATVSVPPGNEPGQPLAAEPLGAEPLIAEPIISAPIVSGPISGPIISAPILEEIVSAPIVEEIVSAPILEELAAAPVGEELAAAPVGEELVSAPIVEEIVSAPILEELDAASGLEAQGPEPTAPPPLDELPSPDDDWEKVTQGPAAFISDEGRKREVALPVETPGGPEQS